jgi:2-keto-3-deoxy-L-rhamnonate aldolase RhmA
MAKNKLIEKMSHTATTCGLWVTLESPSITEIAVAQDLDWIGVDMEHGHLDFKEVMEHIRTVRGSNVTVLVRVPEIQQGTIKRVMDLGAHAVLLPLVRGAEDLKKGISYGRYPMQGVRGVGGERAVKWGLGLQDYLSYANEEVLIIPLIETREAIENIDDILDNPDVKVIFFGPADLSATYGFLGEWEGPGVAEKILDVRERAAKKGIASGIMARSIEDAILRKNQGFNMIGLGSDAGLMIRSIEDTLKALGKDTKVHNWF